MQQGPCAARASIAGNSPHSSWPSPSMDGSFNTWAWCSGQRPGRIGHAYTITWTPLESLRTRPRAGRGSMGVTIMPEENVRESQQPIPHEGVQEKQPSTPNLADIARKWQEIKGAIHEATARGLGRWLAGPGDPAKILNPVLGLTGPGPGKVYGPGRLAGVGNMGQRLRIIEDEGSRPMASLQEVARQNPLIQQSNVRVVNLPPGV